MHPHPHFLPLPPQLHHPYTHHLCQSTTGQPARVSLPDEMYDQEEGRVYTMEDSGRSRLGTAKVKWVLPSETSTQWDGRCCWEPSLD